MNKFTNSCQRCSHLIELFCEKGSATLSTKPTSMMLLALDSVLQIVFLGRDAVPCKLQAAHDESPCRPALAPGLQWHLWMAVGCLGKAGENWKNARAFSSLLGILASSHADDTKLDGYLPWGERGDQVAWWKATPPHAGRAPSTPLSWPVMNRFYPLYCQRGWGMEASGLCVFPLFLWWQFKTNIVSFSE